MGDDYIRRDDAIRLAEQGQVQGFPWQFQMLLRLPSADVVQIVHGRWMPQKGGGLCCSECGRYALDEPDGNFIHVSVPSKFCPHCGAKMNA